MVVNQNGCSGWHQEAFLGERVQHLGSPFGSIIVKSRNFMTCLRVFFEDLALGHYLVPLLGAHRS